MGNKYLIIEPKPEGVTSTDRALATIENAVGIYEGIPRRLASIIGDVKLPFVYEEPDPPVESPESIFDNNRRIELTDLLKDEKSGGSQPKLTLPQMRDLLVLIIEKLELIAPNEFTK